MVISQLTMSPQNNILADLNPEQKKAVLHKDGPLLIIAGAGSGKTRVLTRRAAQLISSGVSPQNILGVTFTNKAADEMRSRIRHMAEHAPVMGTFHSLCARILRKELSLLGMDNNFNIFDGSDQVQLVKQCLKELNIDSKKMSPKAIVEKISRLKDTLMEAAEYSGGAKTFWEDQVSEIYKLYTAKIRAHNALDFGDLILMTIKVFRAHQNCLERYREKFRYILVDEYQDTNYAQYVFLKLLAEKYKNICVVGDPDQSIYSWRGADISNILMFEKDYPKTTVIKLEENYRSTQSILNAANNLISYNKSRKPKNLWTNNAKGEKILYYEALDERDEANFVITKAIELNRSFGISFSDMVVFYRVHAQSRVIEDFLRQHSIQYKILGGISFYARKEIKDIISYLRVIHHTSDDVSILRIINSPSRGIGNTTIEKILKHRSRFQKPIFDILDHHHDRMDDLSAPAKRKLTSFATMIKKMQDVSKGLPVSKLIRKVIDLAGYEQMLARSELSEDKDRIENIRELVTSAKEMEIERGRISLGEFLESVALVSHVDEWRSESDNITLMTLHCAKGMEFPVVFIVGMEETMLPHAGSFSDPGALEEERRLCYVGITRSQTRIILSSAVDRIYNGKYVTNYPSRFIDEISSEAIERITGSEDPEQRSGLQ